MWYHRSWGWAFQSDSPLTGAVQMRFGFAKHFQSLQQMVSRQYQCLQKQSKQSPPEIAMAFSYLHSSADIFQSEYRTRPLPHKCFQDRWSRWNIRSRAFGQIGTAIRSCSASTLVSTFWLSHSPGTQHSWSSFEIPNSELELFWFWTCLNLFELFLIFLPCFLFWHKSVASLKLFSTRRSAFVAFLELFCYE